MLQLDVAITLNMSDNASFVENKDM